MGTKKDKTNETTQEFLSLSELAERWRMNAWGVRNRLSRGLPMPRSLKFPGATRRLFRLRDVKDWEAAQAIETPAHGGEEKKKRGRPTKAESLRKPAAAMAGGGA